MSSLVDFILLIFEFAHPHQNVTSLKVSAKSYPISVLFIFFLFYKYSKGIW